MFTNCLDSRRFDALFTRESLGAIFWHFDAALGPRALIPLLGFIVRFSVVEAFVRH